MKIGPPSSIRLRPRRHCWRRVATRTLAAEYCPKSRKDSVSRGPVESEFSILGRDDNVVSFLYNTRVGRKWQPLILRRRLHGICVVLVPSCGPLKTRPRARPRTPPPRCQSPRNAVHQKDPRRSESIIASHVPLWPPRSRDAWPATELILSTTSARNNRRRITAIWPVPSDYVLRAGHDGFTSTPAQNGRPRPQVDVVPPADDGPSSRCSFPNCSAEEGRPPDPPSMERGEGVRAAAIRPRLGEAAVPLSIPDRLEVMDDAVGRTRLIGR